MIQVPNEHIPALISCANAVMNSDEKVPYPIIHAINLLAEPLNNASQALQKSQQAIIKDSPEMSPISELAELNKQTTPLPPVQINPALMEKAELTPGKYPGLLVFIKYFCTPAQG